MAATKRKNFNYLIATSSFIVIVTALIIITHIPIRPVAANNTPVPTIAPQTISIDSDSVATITTQTSSSKKTHTAMIAVDNTSGSGTFYYVVGATNQANGKQTFSKPVLLGDRIKVTSVVVTDSMAGNKASISVQYLTRTKNTPMATEPTVPTTATFAFDTNGNLTKTSR